MQKSRNQGQLIFEKSSNGRSASAQLTLGSSSAVVMDNPEQGLRSEIPDELLRPEPPALPEVSELQAVRHYTNLSHRNFSIDTHFYPLGSCTMKYNPRGAHKAASLSGFANRHPLAPESLSQGIIGCYLELQDYLQEVTGMAGVSLAPMAGAQGEFAGVAMIRAYHRARGQDETRTEILVPIAAHGTNPATAVMCGYDVREVAVGADGDVDIEALRAAVGPQTAGLMMTNPSTCGVFERRVEEIAAIVHEAGGLLYYDGANLNAILGKTRPGDMGFDVIHMNLHKTFATPHGGGGPGAGPVGVSERLLPHLPLPVAQNGEGSLGWQSFADRPLSIGYLSGFSGNAGILVRALAYGLMLGREGLPRVAEFATLNANYMARRLADAGFELAYPERRATHEFIITFRKEKAQYGVTAMDIAKRLLDYGVHAPTTYFPLLVPECFLIEPTETEAIESLDEFIDALIAIREEMISEPDRILTAPHSLGIGRLDDVKAVRELDVSYASGSTPGSTSGSAAVS